MSKLLEEKAEELIMLQSLIYKIDDDMKIGNDNVPLEIMSKKILELADQINDVVINIKKEALKGDKNEWKNRKSRHWFYNKS